jgi:hypothetical protein
MALEDLTKENLSENVKTKFNVQLAEGRTVELELTEVKVHLSSPRQEMFSLFFHGPQDVLLPQNTYRLEHERLGASDLFLVPVGKDEDGFIYEALFNRLPQGA